MDNPLVSNASQQGNTLPCFDELRPEHFLPAIETLIQNNRQSLDALLATGVENHTEAWSAFLHPLEAMGDQLEKVWAPISHINAVANTDAVREAYSACLPALTQYSTEIGQHRPLYEACLSIKDNPDAYAQLDQAQRRVLDNMLRDFSLAGVALDDKQKQRYADIQQRLAELTTQFSNNVLDATQAWKKHITNVSELDGMPETALASAAALAKAEGLEGYLITLDIPSYLPVMQYCSNRALREELYTAFVTRASEQSPSKPEWDNSQIMEEILSLRKELAELLGFEHYAALSLATKMAGSAEEVVQFLRSLAERSVDKAKAEYAELKAFAEQHCELAELAAWDVPYVSEKLRVERYDVSQEMLRPYFPADTVVNGMFTIVNRLYGIDIEAVQAPSQWHDDVRFYQLKRNGDTIAQFYLDMFARTGKRGGAWMADCRSRRRDKAGDLQIPVAFLTCNFSPPTEGRPSLLTHNEVVTLFHEFGHGLHHMLTQVEAAGVSGINGVAWDAVELPSQFMENWCWAPEAIALISGHYESGETLPKALLDKMLAAKNFQSAMQMVRQLEFSLFDFLIHMQFASPQWSGIQETLDAVRHEVACYAPPAFNRFQHSFSHIFAGGYAAGYYSYKWAEVLSADAFSVFEEQGVFDRDTGQRFLQTILERGGSEPPEVLFEAFRGRAPSVEPLLRHNGIV